MSWASSTWVLFILIMQLVNGAIFKYYLFIGEIICLTLSCSVHSCYGSFKKELMYSYNAIHLTLTQSFKSKLIIFVVRSSWFIIYFDPIFYLKIRGSIWCNLLFIQFDLTSLLIFDIPLLYYYTNVRSSITLCLSFEDVYLSLDICLSSLFIYPSELFCCEVFDIFVIRDFITN